MSSSSSCPLSVACDRLQKNDATFSICNLQAIPLSNRGAIKLATAIKSSSSGLVVLFLNSCEIGSRGATALAEAFRENNNKMSPRYVYMSYNAIGDEAVGALAREGLKNFSVLKLQHCGIGDEGAFQLAEALRRPDCSLQQLYLDGNRIGEAGLTALANSLRTNTSLQVLSIKGNNNFPVATTTTTTTIRETFLTTLQYDNKTLQRLELSSMPIDDDEQHQQQRHVQDQLDHFLRLNRLGRHSFGNSTIPPTVWIRVLARAGGAKSLLIPAEKTTTFQDATNHSSWSTQDLVFCLCRSRPDLLG